jgi:hypothetical protein
MFDDTLNTATSNFNLEDLMNEQTSYSNGRNFSEWIRAIEPPYTYGPVVDSMIQWWYRLEGTFKTRIAFPVWFRPFRPSDAPRLSEQFVTPPSGMVTQVQQLTQGRSASESSVGSTVCMSTQVMQGKRDLGAYDGQYAAAESCEQCQSCGRLWRSSGTCTIQRQCNSALQSRGQNQSPGLSSYAYSFAHGDREYSIFFFFLCGFDHSGFFCLYHAYDAELSTSSTCSSTTECFFPVTSTDCNDPAWAYCHFAHPSILPPKQTDWACQFHLRDEFHRQYIVLKCNNHNPAGLLGTEVDYYLEGMYLRGPHAQAHFMIDVKPGSQSYFQAFK